MVIAYHVVLGMYGFWLPNDPRGSKSHTVWADNLKPFGEATYVTTSHSVAGASHHHTKRQHAKQALKYPPVQLNGHQAKAIAGGFGEAARKQSLVFAACCILPEHAHVVLMRNERSVETMIAHLKRYSGWSLRQSGLHPMEEHRTPEGRVHSVWGREHWGVYIDSPEQLVAAVRYVERNPLKEGKRQQRWSFVTPLEELDL